MWPGQTWPHHPHHAGADQSDHHRCLSGGRWAGRQQTLLRCRRGASGSACSPPGQAACCRSWSGSGRCVASAGVRRETHTQVCWRCVDREAVQPCAAEEDAALSAAHSHVTQKEHAALSGAHTTKSHRTPTHTSTSFAHWNWTTGSWIIASWTIGATLRQCNKNPRRTSNISSPGPWPIPHLHFERLQSECQDAHHPHQDAGGQQPVQV